VLIKWIKILPRNLQPMPPPDPAEDPMAIGPPTNDWVMIKPATSDIAAMDVPVKYCKTCNIWRPPRCYHCRVCDNCVETLDHHCVWLNNCVGRRNYRYFFTFVSAATILSLLMVGACLAQILVYRAETEISFADAINDWRVPWALVIYGALAGPYPASLWAYHLFLIGRGETTREYLNSNKFQKADRHQPFTQANVIRNWISVLARPRPPTYLQFKHTYEPGDQRLGVQKRRYRVQDLEAEAGLEMHVVPPGPAGYVPPRLQHQDYSGS
jgi:palmitoyltransferase ZDHHC9/14/18